MNTALSDKLLYEFQESDLFFEYQRTRSEKIRDLIIERYMHIPHSIAKRYSLKTLDYDDIYQCACLGLFKALQNFKPELGNKFSTYATHFVLGEVKHHLREIGNYIKIPQRVYGIYYKATKLNEKNFIDTGKYLSSEELANILDVLPDEVECALNWGKNKITKSLEQFLHEDDDSMVYSDLISYEDNSLLLIENKLFIEKCLNDLTDEERQFLKYRYYDELSQSEIAQKMNVSQMKISRMQKKVISVLKNMYFEY